MSEMRNSGHLPPGHLSPNLTLCLFLTVTLSLNRNHNPTLTPDNNPNRYPTVAHLVVHGTSSSTSYETTPSVPLETSGGVLSTVDMVVQRRDGPRRLRDDDDNDDDDDEP